MAHATYDDVNLILRLYEMRREEKMRTARDWFVRNCKPTSLDHLFELAPMGSQENAYFRQVATYWEMVASFLVSGVLNDELFFQSGRELLLVWTRLAPIAPAIRERFQDPTQYRNLEIVAQRFIDWMNRHGQGSYDAFKARIS
jgi:hypothetical protein